MSANNCNSQKGSALVISLVILTAITLGAMVAMQRSTTQIRMISNLQHQHEVSNAAGGTLSYIFDQMENNGALQSKMLSKADSLYKDSLAAGSTLIPSFDPFTQYSSQLSQPDFSTKIVASSGITTAVHALPKPSGSTYYLKAAPGCGSGCSVLPAAVTTTAVSKNNTITSVQEIGVQRLIPGGI